MNVLCSNVPHEIHLRSQLVSNLIKRDVFGSRNVRRLEFWGDLDLIHLSFIQLYLCVSKQKLLLPQVGTFKSCIVVRYEGDEQPQLPFDRKVKFISFYEWR